jgi:hypothetical protein
MALPGHDKAKFWPTNDAMSDLVNKWMDLHYGNFKKMTPTMVTTT